MTRKIQVPALSGVALKAKMFETELANNLSTALGATRNLMETSVREQEALTNLQKLLKNSNVSSVSVNGTCDEFNNYWHYPSVLFTDGTLIHWSEIGGSSSVGKFQGHVTAKDFSEALKVLQNTMRESVIFSMNAYVEISSGEIDVDLGITNQSNTRYSDDFLQCVASFIKPL